MTLTIGGLALIVLIILLFRGEVGRVGIVLAAIAGAVSGFVATIGVPIFQAVTQAVSSMLNGIGS